jgi:ferredoxin-thioredoxin reductase catalytic subunit
MPDDYVIARAEELSPLGVETRREFFAYEYCPRRVVGGKEEHDRQGLVHVAMSRRLMTIDLCCVFKELAMRAEADGALLHG